MFICSCVAVSCANAAGDDASDRQTPTTKIFDTIHRLLSRTLSKRRLPVDAAKR
jgi:hypothetical protein